MIKIRYKVLSILLIISLVPQMAVQLLIKSQIEQYAYEQYNLEAEKNRELAALILQGILNNSQRAVELAIKNLDKVYDDSNKPDEFQMSTLLSVVRESVEDVPNFYIGTAEGSFYLYPPDVLPLGYDPRIRNWYQQALVNKNELNWIGPYIDQGTKDLVMTVSKSFNHEGAEGVVGLDVVLNSVRDAIKTKKIGERGALFLVDSNGKIIIHPQQMLEGLDVNLSKYRNESLPIAIKTGRSEGDTYIVETLNVKDTLFVVTTIDKSEIDSLVSQQINKTLYVIYGFIALTGLLALLISARLTKPFKGLSIAMAQVKDGDYTVQFNGYKSRDEIGDLVVNFNELVQHYRANHDEMSALYEELYASEETLMEQYDELLTRKNIIEASEERYRLIFESSTEGIWEIDEQLRLQYHSPKWFSHYDVNLETPNFDDWYQLIHPEDRALFDERFNNHLNGKLPYFNLEYRVMDCHGQYRYIQTKGKALMSADGMLKKLAGSNLDITERKLYEEQTISLAYYDKLTGLPNETNLHKKLQGEMERHNWGQLYLIDINNFKLINDSFGHETGDRLIQEFAKRLKDVYAGAFIARVGGDEFAILFETFNEGKNLEIFGNELLSLVTAPYYLDNIVARISVSIVSTRYPHDAKNVEEVLKNLDLTLYYVKTQKVKSIQLYEEQIKLEISRRLYIENNLERALEHREFVLVFQPILSIRHSNQFQFEALIRWQDPIKGLIMPDEFIGIAENTGAILSIGKWVISEALAIQKSWIDHFGLEISLSVNISMSQLADDSFLDFLKEQIDLHGIKPQLFAIEVIESLTYEDFKDIPTKLSQIKALGIKVALDDFGKGYSSLDNLINLPLDLLKIDRKITSRVTDDIHIRALYESIIEYAHRMSIDVVVEGIENSEQADLFEKISADYLQGYLYSKPIPKEIVMQYIQRKQ